MKQVCAASPGKFASALLDILDGTIDNTSDNPSFLPMVNPEPEEDDLKKVVTKNIKKRPAAQAAADDCETPAKKAKTTAKQEKHQERVDAEEKRLAIERTKELNKSKLSTIKETARRKGLDQGKKGKMIESIVASEAKVRENVRKHKANARDVLVLKREEFGKKTNKALKELLQAYALQTSGTKPERIERLLVTWQEQGEIEKVLAGMAFQARKAELNAMDKTTLFELCKKKGVDALSKEVLVDRLLVHESVDIWQEVVEARRQTK
jgi:hypothetical protein